MCKPLPKNGRFSISTGDRRISSIKSSFQLLYLYQSQFAKPDYLHTSSRASTWFVRWWRTLWEHSNSHKHCGVPGCYIKLLSCRKFCVIRIYHVSNLTRFGNPNSRIRIERINRTDSEWIPECSPFCQILKKKHRVLIEGLCITRKSPPKKNKKKFIRLTTSVGYVRASRPGCTASKHSFSASRSASSLRAARTTLYPAWGRTKLLLSQVVHFWMK